MCELLELDQELASSTSQLVEGLSIIPDSVDSWFQSVELCA